MSEPLPKPGTEAWYAMRDEFVRYIAKEVNPAREAAGLKLMDLDVSRECFRIINDFQRNWETK